MTSRGGGPSPSIRPASRLMLGTVQWGMPYGVANRTGPPSLSVIASVLSEAALAGIDSLDTAAVYGESEARIGEALAETGLRERFQIVTKVRPLSAEERSDPAAARSAIRQSVEQSLRRLRTEHVETVLFHREEDAPFLDELRALRDRGWIRECGVSCGHEPESVLKLLAAYEPDALQLPGNLLDQRHKTGGVFKHTGKRPTRVYLRSVFLQGLLAMAECDVPAHLSDVIPVRRRLEALAKAQVDDADPSAESLAELALRYGLTLTGPSRVLVGVETLEQLRRNIECADRGPLSESLMTRIETAALGLPTDLISPGDWPQRVARCQST